MKLLFDFLPIVLFFAVFKLHGIMAATAVAMAASILMAAYGWLRHRKVEPMQMISAGLIVVFGGATLLLADERFIKVKPTILYLVLAGVFAGSHLMGKPLTRKVFASLADGLNPSILARLNHWWVGFFTMLGGLNLWVAWRFSTDVWVSFKLFGLLGLTVVFVLAQGLYLSRHYVEPEGAADKPPGSGGGGAPH
ncbi:MAG: septation protein A [Nitrospirota bacterium]|nr:septation protein A [Nitrospirota bacterium]